MLPTIVRIIARLACASVACVVVAAMGSCSGSAAPPSTVAESASEPVCRTTALTDCDACRLLTAAEIEQVTGHELVRTLHAPGRSGPITSSCSYHFRPADRPSEECSIFVAVNTTERDWSRLFEMPDRFALVGGLDRPAFVTIEDPPVLDIRLDDPFQLQLAHRCADRLSLAGAREALASLARVVLERL